MPIKHYLLEGAPVAFGDSGALFIYNLLPVGKFIDKRYGEVWIGMEMLQKMESNFGRYPAYEVPVKIGHGDGAQSPGRVIGIKAKPEGLEITMTVDQEAADAINNKRYRYMSAEFDENYKDKTTGENVGPVLLGAALVNQPADPYVQPLILAEDVVDDPEERGKTNERKENMPDLAELLQQRLADAEAREAAARREYDASLKRVREETTAAKAREDKAQKKISDLEAKNRAAEKARASMEQEKRKAEVDAFCGNWSSKGVPPAVLGRLKPILLAEGNFIKLSETESTSLVRLFTEVFEAMPKFDMGQKGLADTGDLELSDVEKARAKGAAMAARVNSDGMKKK